MRTYAAIVRVARVVAKSMITYCKTRKKKTVKVIQRLNNVRDKIKLDKIIHNNMAYN